jgi:hypothetical protein
VIAGDEDDGTRCDALDQLADERSSCCRVAHAIEQVPGDEDGVGRARVGLLEDELESPSALGAIGSEVDVGGLEKADPHIPGPGSIPR